MKKIGMVSSVLACAASLVVLAGCGGGGGATPITSVFHISWVGSPAVDQVKVWVGDNKQVRLLHRADGDGDLTLNVDSATVVHIQGLDQFGFALTEQMDQPAQMETSLKVGGTPTQATLYRAHRMGPINNSTVNLTVGTGCEIVPVPTDAQGAICVVPGSDFSLAFNNSSVVDYSAPLLVGGHAPGSTNVDVVFQSSTALGQFSVSVQ